MLCCVWEYVVICVWSVWKCLWMLKMSCDVSRILLRICVDGKWLWLRWIRWMNSIMRCWCCFMSFVLGLRRSICVVCMRMWGWCWTTSRRRCWKSIASEANWKMGWLCLSLGVDGGCCCCILWKSIWNWRFVGWVIVRCKKSLSTARRRNEGWRIWKSLRKTWISLNCWEGWGCMIELFLLKCLSIWRIMICCFSGVRCGWNWVGVCSFIYFVIRRIRFITTSRTRAIGCLSIFLLVVWCWWIGCLCILCESCI